MKATQQSLLDTEPPRPCCDWSPRPCCDWPLKHREYQGRNSSNVRIRSAGCIFLSCLFRVLCYRGGSATVTRKGSLVRNLWILHCGGSPSHHHQGDPCQSSKRLSNWSATGVLLVKPQLWLCPAWQNSRMTTGGSQRRPWTVCYMRIN